MKKGQSGIEMVSVLSFIFLASIALLVLLQGASQQGSDEANVLQARNSVKMIAEACDELYYQGGNSEKTVHVFIPQGVERVEIGGVAPGSLGNEVTFKTITSYGKTDVVMMTIPRVSAPAGQAWMDTPGTGLVSLRLKLTRLPAGELAVEITAVN
ncbi:hypothetical protein HY992_00510 [Candidatus Micrarchaeota archaeon]|nr:hypothetical protein [Candidatus Micrarchaeota archaeon]